MKQINLPILKILLALIAGILVYDAVKVPLSWLIGFIFFCIVIVGLFHRLAFKKSLLTIPFTLGILCLFVGLGYLTMERSDVLNDSDHYTYHVSNSQSTFLFDIVEQLKPTLYQDKFIARVKTVDGNIISGKVLLNVHKDSTQSTLKVGDWYHSRTSLLPLPKPKNPYQFDYGTYLERKQIYGQISVDYAELLLSKHSSSGLKVWSSRFRESVLQALHAYPFSKNQLAIIDALVLGQRQGIDKEMSTQYASAGMMHILAVSGLHVGIVLLLLRFITKPISDRKLRLLRSTIIIVLIWAFAFITGLSPSVLRAATMFSFLEVGQSLGGKRKTADAVLASALFLLLYDPLLIYQVGFQLSYLAVIGILWIQPWLSGFYVPKFYLDRLFWGIATVTTAAQIGVLPLSLFYFHQFPGLFFISNMVILPFLGLILGCGIIVAMLAVTGLLPHQLVTAYGWVIDLMNSFIFWVADKETFITKHITISFTLLITLYLCITLFIALFQKFKWWKLVASGVSLIVLSGVLIYEKTVPVTPHLTVFNKSKSTLIGAYANSSLQLYSSDSISGVRNDSRVLAYQDGTRLKKISIDSMRNYFRFKRKEILVIDSLGIYGLRDATPDYVLLTQSPQINLYRLLETYPDIEIIADASNYRTYVERWKATCEHKKIPFHSTYEKGAYVVK